MKVDSIPCYIRNLNTNAVVNFDVEIPQSVSDQYTANFTEQGTKGRSSPFMAYENSGPRQVSFSVLLAADIRRQLVKTVEALRDMLKPVNSDYLKYPKVLVRIGDVVNMTAVPTAFDVDWSNGYISNVYRTCECSFSFTEIEENTSSSTSVGTYSAASVSDMNTSNSGSAKSGDRKARATNYDIGDKYKVGSPKYGWAEFEGAYNNDSSTKNKVDPGDYYVTAVDRGMLNISLDKNTPDIWVRG